MPETSLRAAVRIVFEPGRRNPAAMRRRYRNGTAAYTGKDPEGGALPVEIRNGRPFKPYVYLGLGYDQLTGERDA